jgi:4-hydroxy-tetrahydrodipicolinate reductase
MVKVAVAGALGRMGRVACNALKQAADVTYAGGLARTAVPDERIFSDLEPLLKLEQPDVLLDLTTYPDSVQISMNALIHGVRPVVGASGWRSDECEALNREATERGLGAMIVPNFSIGAVLMMKFADQAARYFPSAEVVELHHDQKKDAPSGTARLTAQRISLAGGPQDVPIHSVRMKGLVAHQEVLFGIEGELLTIRHDSLSRESFVPGMLAAARRVMQIRGLQVGLDA